MDDILAELRGEFVVSVREQLTAAGPALDHLQREPAALEPLETLRHLFHRLAGSGGTYGLPLVSELGLEAELIAKARQDSSQPVESQDLARWRDLLVALQEELERASLAATEPTATEPSAAAARATSRPILILTDRAALPLLDSSTAADAAPLHAVCAPGEVDRALRQQRPRAIVVDLALEGALPLISGLRRRVEAWDTPMIGVADQLTPAERLELQQLGVDAFLAPGSPVAALEALLEEVRTGPGARPLVLIATNDDALADRLVGFLDDLHVVSERCPDPAALAEQRWLHAPDLLLLDSGEEGASALRLIARLREQVTLLASTLLVIARPEASLDRAAAIGLGADEVTPLSAIDEALPLTLRLRLGMARLLLERVGGQASHRAAPAADEREPSSTALASGPVRVLVADDDAAVRLLIGRHLEGLGWQVVLAEDGEQAERALTEQSFHIALLDVLMPFHTGFDLLSWINDNRRHRPLKVVILTALSQDENLLRAFDLGADDFIAKPFNPDVVVGRLRRLLRPS